MEIDILQEQIKAINKLYITNRNSYIVQNKDGSYTNSNVFKSPKLTDAVIRHHLTRKKTVGIFCLDKFTKHITFDVDASDINEKNRQRIVLNLIDKIEKCGISRDCCTVSYSGAKGYHCTIHFDDLVYLNKAYDFYEYILSECGYSNALAEFRPLPNIGQKIPIGIHRKTMSKCFFVDYDNCFKEIKDDLYISKIRTYDRDLFESIIDDISIDKIKLEKIRVISNQLSPNKLKLLSLEDMESIEKYGIINFGTRNFCSIQLSVYYNTLGLSRYDANKRLDDWLLCQDRDKFKTGINRCLSENKKITDWVYNNNIVRRVSFEVPKSINIFKRELDVINKIDNIKLRYILLCILIHCKIYKNQDGVFSMTYDQIADNCGIKNRTLISNAIKYFKENELIDYTSSKTNPTDKKPNKYTVNFMFSGIRKVGIMQTILSSEYSNGYHQHLYLVE